jgi:hypothetical protein
LSQQGLAQDSAPPPRTPRPPTDPELDDPALEDDARALEKPGDPEEARVSPSVAKEREPTQPGLPGALEALPGLEGADFVLRAPAIRSEGVFLTMQRGSLVRGKGGEWWFVFHRDAEGRAQRPMILIPGQTLERMVAAADDLAPPVFRATGQVFVYYGRNYFLPTTAHLASGAESTEPAPEAPASEGGDGEGDPSVQDLMGELLGEGDRARALGAQVGGGGASETTGASEGLAEVASEGRLVARRRGRIVRQGAAWAFAFDNDGQTPAERPMILVPSLNLESMERIASKQGDGIIFELSGRVLAFRGRNYIIPTMFQVVRDREVRPLQ